MMTCALFETSIPMFPIRYRCFFYLINLCPITIYGKTIVKTMMIDDDDNDNDNDDNNSNNNHESMTILIK